MTCVVERGIEFDAEIGFKNMIFGSTFLTLSSRFSLFSYLGLELKPWVMIQEGF